uniref:Uncharacterized protein n=1 Tax=Arundo donax TaxID=35708 RepID=A0A0A9CFJ7_ARUDO
MSCRYILFTHILIPSIYSAKKNQSAVAFMLIQNRLF